MDKSLQPDIYRTNADVLGKKNPIDLLRSTYQKALNAADRYKTNIANLGNSIASYLRQPGMQYAYAGIDTKVGLL